MTETPAAGTPAPAAPAPETTTPAPAPAAAAPDASAAQPASLLPDEGWAPAPATAPAAAPAAPPAETPTWFYADGTPGKGTAPDWFKADKYKTVDQQAKAYAELEKRFGSFVGAPKDGKYAPPPLPEGVQGEFNTEHPIFAKLTDWAAKSQLSQDGFNTVMNLLAEYEASRAPDINEAKKALGPDADARITATAQWAKANLDAEGYQTLRAALSGDQAAAVFKVVEQLIGKTRVTMPKPADDTSNSQLQGRAKYTAMYAEKLPDGRRRFEVDAAWRRQCEAVLMQVIAEESKAA